MLTNLTIRNFKRFESIDIELGDRVVMIGPNNSGKTSALQALALWDVGLKRWIERRGAGTGNVPSKRPGVTINRRDLIAVPVPQSNLLWRNLHVRESMRGRGTRNVRIEIVVQGISDGCCWQCGLEFDYANDESFYCRPLRLTDDSDSERMPIPPQAAAVRVAFLPPMSGLTATETRLDAGAINVRLGEGRTAEVLRNLCYQIREAEDGEDRWRRLAARISHLFRVDLEEPQYVTERGEVTLAYRDSGVRQPRFDISSSGRGLQQTLLLLAHMHVNPGAVLLLDEPDAHLEILRQQQIYQELSDAVREAGSQIIAASHSEVLLNMAASRDIVLAFVGRPHRIDNRGSQLAKALKEIGFEDYYRAEETGWILYLEGSTDLALLRAFAGKLNHPAQELLERPFVHYVGNQTASVSRHFFGLREAKSDLVAFAVFDRLNRALPDYPDVGLHAWRRREIENYIVTRDVLLAWARSFAADNSDGPLFQTRWVDQMENSIAEIEAALTTLRAPSPWSDDIKVTDDFLDPLFDSFFDKLGLPNIMRKTNYHVLVDFIGAEALDDEIAEVLDLLMESAGRAQPRRD